MKRLLLITVCFLFLIGLANAQEFEIRVTKFSYSNWLIGWGVDYAVKLKNTGDITAKNIHLMFIDEVSNETFTYKDTSYADWGESLIPTKEKKKTFNRSLPKGFKVISSLITVFRE